MTLSEAAVRWKSPVWIATVLDEGDVLQEGVNAGYSYVVGATTHKDDATRCQERFKGIPNVRVFHGEEIILHEVIRDINVAITFCLDSRSEPAPALIQELGVLKHHRIKSHVIIVRNLSLLEQVESGGITLWQVHEAIRRINNGYTFTEHDDGDFLVATYP